MAIVYVSDCRCCGFFFNDTATTEIYTLSLHDALPIFGCGIGPEEQRARPHLVALIRSERTHGQQDAATRSQHRRRSEEHTSELQSRQYLVCRLLLEKNNHELIGFLLLRLFTTIILFDM